MARGGPHLSALYRYRDIRILHLEPTVRCQAACPMCGRNLAGGRTRASIGQDEIAVEAFAAWFEPVFLRQLVTFFMCGNFGDPIVARDCLPILETARHASGRLNLSINTNGSARPPDFWRALADLRVTVRFALDGATAASHARYRRNTSFDAVLRNAETFVAAGGRAIWDMLVFRHNEHEVEAAEALARRIGFREFVVKSTTRFGGDRFEVRNAAGAVVDALEPSRRFPAEYLAAKPTDDALRTCAIDCKVAATGSLYVAASGLVFPCCWLGAVDVDRPGLPDSRHDLPGQGARMASYHELVAAIGRRNLDLHHTPLPVIVERYLPHFARRWGPGPERLVKCAQICGRTGVDQFASTFVSTRDLRPAVSAG